MFPEHYIICSKLHDNQVFVETLHTKPLSLPKTQSTKIYNYFLIIIKISYLDTSIVFCIGETVISCPNCSPTFFSDSAIIEQHIFLFACCNYWGSVNMPTQLHWYCRHLWAIQLFFVTCKLVTSNSWCENYRLNNPFNNLLFQLLNYLTVWELHSDFQNNKGTT